MVTEVTGSVVQRCVGIVADKFKAKALRNLEVQHHWMVNTACQLQGLTSLIKDFNCELPLFRVVIENCLKVANFIDNELHVRSVFLKYRMQEMDCGGLIRVQVEELVVALEVVQVGVLVVAGVFELKYNLNSMYTICHAMQGSFMEAK